MENFLLNVVTHVWNLLPESVEPNSFLSKIAIGTTIVSSVPNVRLLSSAKGSSLMLPIYCKFSPSLLLLLLFHNNRSNLTMIFSDAQNVLKPDWWPLIHRLQSFTYVNVFNTQLDYFLIVRRFSRNIYMPSGLFCTVCFSVLNNRAQRIYFSSVHFENCQKCFNETLEFELCFSIFLWFTIIS